MIRLAIKGVSKIYPKLNARRGEKGHQNVDVIIGEDGLSKSTKRFLGDGCKIQFHGQKNGNTVYVGFGDHIIFGDVSKFYHVKIVG